MRRLHVDQVIQLAAGLFGMPERKILRPDVGMQSVVRDAAVLIAHLHCDRPVAFIAGVFLMRIEDARQAITFGTDMLNDTGESSAYGWRAARLHNAVLRLKAAWRREAAMQRWRAQQEPTPREYGPWRPRDTRQNVELTRSRLKPVRSIWTEEAAQ